MSVTELRQRWRRLCAEAKLAGSADALFAVLETAYSAPDRHYHTLAHVAACLEAFDAARHLAEHPLAVELALFYHDLVYDTRANDCEQQSASEAHRSLVAAGAGPALASTVSDLVLATRHRDLGLLGDRALVADVDLTILGQPAAEFDCYEAAVRREYGWVPDAIFWRRRAELLRGFLARPAIYSTGCFRGRLELVARHNLERSIAARRPP